MNDIQYIPYKDPLNPDAFLYKRYKRPKELKSVFNAVKQINKYLRPLIKEQKLRRKQIEDYKEIAKNVKLSIGHPIYTNNLTSYLDDRLWIQPFYIKRAIEKQKRDAIKQKNKLLKEKGISEEKLKEYAQKFGMTEKQLLELPSEYLPVTLNVPKPQFQIPDDPSQDIEDMVFEAEDQSEQLQENDKKQENIPSASEVFVDSSLSTQLQKGMEENKEEEQKKLKDEGELKNIVANFQDLLAQSENYIYEQKGTRQVITDLLDLFERSINLQNPEIIYALQQNIFRQGRYQQIINQLYQIERRFRQLFALYEAYTYRFELEQPFNLGTVTSGFLLFQIMSKIGIFKDYSVDLETLGNDICFLSNTNYNVDTFINLLKLFPSIYQKLLDSAKKNKRLKQCIKIIFKAAAEMGLDLSSFNIKEKATSEPKKSKSKKEKETKSEKKKTGKKK